MNLVSPSVRHATDFNQPEQCQSYLHGINVTEPDEAAAACGVLLEGMAVASPPPRDQFKVLEELRSSLEFVLGELAKRYASRPLPPSSDEQYILHQVVRLWSLMVTNYGFVSQRFTLAHGTVPEEFRAMLTQRRLRYQSLVMMEYFRARQELPQSLWQDLHKTFAAAERAGLATTRVADPLNDIWGAQSPLECYVATLLVDAASPYSRTPREFTWLIRWAQRFAPYCSIKDDVAQAGNLYLLEPDADHGLRPATEMSPAVRVRSMDTKRLASHIQSVVSQLKAGATPASLGLGEDCAQPACARLLVSLYRPWGLASAGRKFPRRRTQGTIRLCSDLYAVAFYLAGKKFEFPDSEQVRYTDYSRTEIMLALGERVAESPPSEEQIDARAVELGYIPEVWAVMDQSVAGFRLSREQPGSRVEHRQLVGIRAGNAGRMMLAEISWLQYQRDGVLCAGVSLMPGPAQVCPVRLHGGDRQPNGRDRSRLAFLIPGVPALKTPPSLIIPAGWYASGRSIEVCESVPWVARMTRLMGRGANFDRVSFAREESVAVPESGR